MSRSGHRYCRTCGAEAPGSGRFCPSCGSSLSLTTPYPAPGGSLNHGDPRDFVPPREPIRNGTPPSPTPVVMPSVAGSARMGFGIALGMLLFGLLTAGIVTISIAVANGAITWPFAERGQRFEGRGPAESEPLALEGPVAIEWTASPISPAACRFAGWLVTQSDPSFTFEIAMTMVDRAQASGVPRAIELGRRSDYVLRIESDCAWTVRVVGG